MKLTAFFSIARDLTRVKFFKKKIPMTFSWVVTYRCNLSCKYCGYWREKTEELSTGQIFLILDGIKDAGGRWISFTAGEPLMRDH